jgi:hypothetical protein
LTRTSLELLDERVKSLHAASEHEMMHRFLETEPQFQSFSDLPELSMDDLFSDTRYDIPFENLNKIRLPQEQACISYGLPHTTNPEFFTTPEGPYSYNIDFNMSNLSHVERPASICSGSIGSNQSFASLASAVSQSSKRGRRRWAQASVPELSREQEGAGVSMMDFHLFPDWMGDLERPDDVIEDGSTQSPLKVFGSEFQCGFCEKKFSRRYEWNRHEESKHVHRKLWVCNGILDPEPTPVSCPYDGLLNPTDEHLARHHHHSCVSNPIEKRTFARHDHLTQHLKQHHKIADLGAMRDVTRTWKINAPPLEPGSPALRCKHCGLCFDTWEERVSHVAKHFANPKAELKASPIESARRRKTPTHAQPNKRQRVGGPSPDYIARPNPSFLAKPLPCLLANYGCSARKFTSMQEWKRHLNAQHFRVGFWRCDMCSNHFPSTNNDFNRKDLFTQHVLRIHLSKEDLLANNADIAKHQLRCYIHLREYPPESRCVVCQKEFSSREPDDWNLYLEHVASHYELERMFPKVLDGLEPQDWKIAAVEEDWLLKERLIARSPDGSWEIGGGRLV